MPAEGDDPRQATTHASWLEGMVWRDLASLKNSVSADKGDLSLSDCLSVRYFVHYDGSWNDVGFPDRLVE